MKRNFNQFLKTLLGSLLMFSLFFSCEKEREPEITTGSVDGMISDAVTLQPVAGANISINPGNFSSITGNDGKYVFNDLEPGEYTLQVTKDSYQSNSKSITVIAGRSSKSDISLSPEVPVLAVNVSSLDFGSSSTTLPLEIRNTGASSLDWTISENVSWISANPISGTTTNQVSYVNIVVNRTGLSQGNYSQSISITSNGGSYTVMVYLTIPNPYAPEVTCANASNVSQTTAEVSGNIVSIGSSSVMQYGHCWSTNPNPTILDNYTTLGSTSSSISFVSQLTALSPTTTYYVRAYATNSNGTGYSTSQSFTTSATPTVPQVTTQIPWNISDVAANVNGQILDVGNSSIIQHGHCWSLNPNPTISNYKTELGPRTTTGSFTSILTNLATNNTYHVRAYATNGAGTVYGTDQVFVPSLDGKGYQMFYFSQPSYLTKVYVNGLFAGEINIYYPSSIPNCFDDGCVTVALEPGTYNWVANCSIGSWSGEFTIEENICKKTHLIVSKNGSETKLESNNIEQ